MNWFAMRGGIAEYTTLIEEFTGKADAPLGRSSAMALIAANVVVGLMALFLGWNCTEMLLVFWLEGLVIGGVHAMKFLVVILLSEEPFGKSLGRWVDFKSIFSRIFFAFLGINVFIVSFVVVAMIAYVVTFALIGGQTGLKGGGISEKGIVFALVPLTASHGYSFFCHFCKAGEYRKTSIGNVFVGPYVRLWLVALVLGIGLLLSTLLPWLGTATVYTVVIVGAKTFADLISHRREHSRMLQQPDPGIRESSLPRPRPTALPKSSAPPPLPGATEGKVRTGKSARSPFRFRVASILSIPSFLILLAAVFVFANKAGAEIFETHMGNSAGILLVALTIVAILTLITGTSAVVYSIKRPGPKLVRVLLGGFNVVAILAAIAALLPIGLLIYILFIVGGGPG